MAKIALISQHWTEPIEALAKSLKEQRHDVLFITDRQTTVDSTIDMQVFAYFKRWSAWEALKLFPRLLSETPDIWHFVFTNPQSEKPRSAHWAMAGLAQSLPGRAVAASLYGSVLTVNDFSWKPFLKLCDFVTLGTRESLMSFKRRGFLPHRKATEVLPPILRSEEPESHRETVVDDLIRLTDALQPYLLVFSDRLPSELKHMELAAPFQLLILGSRTKKVSFPNCYFVSEKLNRKELEILSQKSRAILVAFDELSVLELVRIQNIALKTGAFLIANSRQTELCPGLCIHKKTGWVIEPKFENLRQLLLENPRLTLPPVKWSEVMHNPVDSTMNELHRLYTKAMDKKH